MLNNMIPGGDGLNYRYLAAGDRALLISLGDEISPALHQRVRELFFMLQQAEIEGIIELIPAYSSLMVSYDPLQIEYRALVSAIEALKGSGEDLVLPPSMVTEIPVCYGAELGPDLDFVAEYNGIGRKEVIELHSDPCYLIYMLGFSPGFTYLGGLSEKLYTPRLKKPRTSIPAGSVGIALQQTGIYPVASPGGWQIIGQTPVRLFDPDREKQPVLLRMGDFVQFKAVNVADFREIQQLVTAGGWETKSYPLGEEGADGQQAEGA